jgi:glycosyltransferase involved in cell wall biosynthesis
MNSRRGILIAASIYPPDSGGPALHAKKQYDFFQQQGFSVSLVALAHYRAWPKVVRHLFYFVALFFRALNVDLLYAHDALGVGLPAVLVARLLNKKIIMRIGGDLLWEREAQRGKTELSMNEWYKKGLHSKKLSYEISSFVLRNIDHLIVPSPLLSTLYETYYGVPPALVSIIANPVPTEITSKSSINTNSIVFASRLVKYKNLLFVLKSMAKVLPQFPQVTFCIYGDGPERNKLETYSHELGISRQVLFKGLVSQDEVVKETKSCLFTLAPALTEFNPNYVLQGLSSGKPFLISLEHGFPFPVPEQFIFDQRDNRDFEKKLTWMLSDAGYQEALALVRTMSISQSWDNTLKQNIEVIKTVLSK